MTFPQFQRDALKIRKLSERVNKLQIQRDQIDPKTYRPNLSPEAEKDVQKAASEIRRAKERGASRILTFGAHSIKNGLSAVMTALLEGGWINHFATNGAGIIHDWEFAFQGESGENVERYVSKGQFGIWDETGRFINLAIVLGAYQGFGYAESVGQMIKNNGLDIPSPEELTDVLAAAATPNANDADLSRAAAAADLLASLRHFQIPSGFLTIPHSFPIHSLAYQAHIHRIPFTCHPMIGHDIIYTHPVNKGAAIGRTAERDFLSFVDSVAHLEGGVYLSVGSAVMSPMIFEKALSMARNRAFQENKKIQDFAIHVVDLAQSNWDWETCGEPPMDNPAYYLRYCKTFHRMGGKMTYVSADNRDWLVALWQTLNQQQ